MKIPKEAEKMFRSLCERLDPEFKKLGLVQQTDRPAGRGSWAPKSDTYTTIAHIHHRSTGEWSMYYQDTALRISGRYREPRFTARSIVLWDPRKGAIDDKGFAKLIALVAERVRLEKIANAAEAVEEEKRAAAKKMVAALRRELGRVPELHINSATADFFPCVDIQLIGNDPDDLKRKLRDLATAILDECPKPKESMT